MTAWAGGNVGGGREVAEDAAFFQVVMPEQSAPAPLLIWPENVPFFRLFTALASQWRWLSVGGGMAPGIVQRTGLDYGVVPHLAPAYGVTMDANGWARIRAAEAAALEVWNR